MSRIAIIGSGKIGSALATRFHAAGIAAVIANSRGPASLVDFTLRFGGTIKAVETEEALGSDIVILAMHFDAVPAAVGERGDWNGRIVVDATNAINFPDFTPRDLNGRLSTEVISELVPGARIVKAFNTLQAPILAADPKTGAGRRVLFLSGDDAGANGVIADLIHELGFFPIDLGPLSVGAPMQQFAGPLAKLTLLKD
ncbi:NADP oxidoreductase [Neorhizobium lilium]|uniref:NADP oxidoreductase n=1 Tax=Neorhizobium lilium TaxID=2503024 RepID=A0A3S3RPK3_9HYPH|nr:NADPH-dependent F420 reductase [Neorhizobium lilium]RWX74685.1 NADP oxidoreductase [Neorhizobium lilium]